MNTTSVRTGGIAMLGGIARVAAAAVLLLLTAGCSIQAILGAVGGTTIIGARSPSHEIEQTYYLGVFDPDDQVPPSLYRVTVHGQASLISLMRFASGWVPAHLIDSLDTNLQFRKKGESAETSKGGGDLEVYKGDPELRALLQTGKRLMLFGPEGFREAPSNHRLVVIMGQSPEEYFEAVDQVLGAITAARGEQAATPDDKRRMITQSLLKLSDERERLEATKKTFESKDGGQ